MLNLTRLLSDNLLTGSLINAIMILLQERAAERPDMASQVHFGTVLFAEHLVSAHKDKLFSSPTLQRYTEAFTNGSEEILYFPVNITNSHWISFCVDFENHHICHGASLPICFENRFTYTLIRRLAFYPLPKHIYNALHSWLRPHVKSKFKEGSQVLGTTKQNDGHSCGVCSSNSCAHDAFGDALWTPDTKVFQHMTIFQDIVSAYEKQVSTSMNIDLNLRMLQSAVQPP